MLECTTDMLCDKSSLLYLAVQPCTHVLPDATRKPAEACCDQQPAITPQPHALCPSLQSGRYPFHSDHQQNKHEQLECTPAVGSLLGSAQSWVREKHSPGWGLAMVMQAQALDLLETEQAAAHTYHMSTSVSLSFAIVSDCAVAKELSPHCMLSTDGQA